jgi:uncharacterized protein (DUF433 family)
MDHMPVSDKQDRRADAAGKHLPPDKPRGHVFAFSADQVCRLTSLSNRQLRYWDDTEFFPPAFREEVRNSPYARVYSYRDVVGLRAIAELRKTYGIPLQHLRRVGSYLGERYTEPWAQLTFYVVGRVVFYQEEKWAAIASAEGTGQQFMEFALRRVEGDVNKEIARLRTRDTTQVGRIIQHRFVAQNRPVLDGTRVPTEAIWEFHVAEYPMTRILAEYPQLRAEDVDAAIDFERKRPRRRRRKAA